MSLLQVHDELQRLPVDSLGDEEDWQPKRSEKREKVVRIVEYSEYPRVRRDQQRRIGFTRDQSTSGMCIAADKAEQPGALLRLALRNVDGGATLEAVMRVAWCAARPDGRYWVGLAMLEASDRRMRKVRRPAQPGRIEGEGSGDTGGVRWGDRRR